MRRPSVAQALGALERERMAALSPEERIAEALSLGERDLDLYAKVHGLERREARRALERSRQAGRRPSGCIDELIG